MIQRIAYGALAIAVILSLVGGDALVARMALGHNALLAHGSLIPVVLALIAVVACLELEALFRAVGVQIYRGWAIASCLTLLLAPWFSAAGFFGSGPYETAAFHLQMEVAGLVFVGTGVVAVMRRDVSGGLLNVAATWMVIGYAGILLGFLMLLRTDANMMGETGAWVVLSVILVCKVSDIGAYFLGSWFGKHKLIPAVSPGKSVEGFVGGLLASILLSALLWKVHSATLNSEDPMHTLSLVEGYLRLAHVSTMAYAPLNLMQAIVFGLVISFVGQLGDLIESVFKRSAKAKDSASILPGFGGILDMIDSPVAVAPVAWFLLTRVWGVL